jgi:Domain of unknown function (DUF4345)
MNSRTITGVIGAITLLFGIVGLFWPEVVMTRVVGFSVLPSFSANFARGEVRAVYGGLFTLLGIYTLLAATNPVAHGGRIFFLGLIWLSFLAGRMVGVVVDGSPGVTGWVSAAFELVVGGLLIFAAQTARSSAPASAPPTVPTE